MTPAARIAAVVEILDRVAEGRRPADEILRNDLRRRRYAGGGDRRAIGDMLFAVLRRIVAIDLRLGSAPKSGRLRVAAWLAEQDGLAAPDMLFNGEGYAPAALDQEERAVLEAPSAPLPDWAEVNLPEWLVPSFVRRFDDAWPAHAEALNRPARVDLRVNHLKTTRDQALHALAEAGIEAVPTPYAPDGIAVAGRIVLRELQAYKAGWFEPQDEASQLVAQLVRADPGMTVVDLCAGAGGKTLALAAAMADRGRLIACDSQRDRLDRLAPRADRAGAAAEYAEPEALELNAVADRVLVDAPCSGTGMWRRQPDARLRLDPAELSRLTAVQAGLIRRAARICRPGGRVIYAVCSVLPEEGPDLIAQALAADPTLTPIAPWSLAHESGLDALPADSTTGAHGLCFDPLTTRTDGFFVAALNVREGSAS